MKENTLTKSDLRRLHTEYNQLYFGGRLSMPTFLWLTGKSPYGRYIMADNLIQISVTAKRWSAERLKDTLIHEMIHQYIYEHLFGCRYVLIQHGLRFYYVRWRLKRRYGLHISGGPIF